MGTESPGEGGSDRTASLEAEVAESSRRYRTIFETTGTGTFIIDEKMTILLANEEFVRLTGYAKEEMEGKKKGTDFILPEDLPLIRRYYEMREKDPDHTPRSYEIRTRHRNGTVHDGMISISKIPGTGQRVISFMDITEKKRAEREMYRAEKMAALGQLVAGVAHEISNPNNFVHFNLPVLERYLAAIDVMVEGEASRDPAFRILGLTADDFRRDLRSLIRDLKHGTARIGEIVSDLKSHVSSDMSDEWGECSVGEVIDRARHIVGKQIEKKVRRLEWSVPADLPRVMMMPGRIEQTVINLMVNAAHAIDKEESWIRVGAARVEDGRSVEIAVSDNGCGIPEDVRQRIFEPFFTTKCNEGGTGLGLWISQDIVRDHGGTIRVDSTPGTGSTFTVTLPLDGRRRPVA